MRSSCCHSMSLGEGTFCGLTTSRELEPGVRSYVFHTDMEFIPITCGDAMFRACPYRAGKDGKEISSRGTVYCDHCKGRHVPGSLTQKLCGEWHSFKRAYHEMNRSPGKKWYEHGSSVEIFSDDCTPGLRKQLWPRIQVSILRRDKFTCQECGRSYKQLPKKRNGRASLEVHHIIPRSMGGTEHPGNLVTLCRDCHREHTNEGILVLRVLQRNETELRRLCLEEHILSLDEDLPDDLSSLEYE